MLTEFTFHNAILLESNRHQPGNCVKYELNFNKKNKYFAYYNPITMAEWRENFQKISASFIAICFSFFSLVAVVVQTRAIKL